MTAKSKRPAVLDLGDLRVGQPKAQTPAPAPKEKPETGLFRTSVFLPRIGHRKLREIAFEENKSVAELVREGLDHVLTSRNFPTMAELESKAE